jgi:hypothetical protein
MRRLAAPRRWLAAVTTRLAALMMVGAVAVVALACERIVYLTGEPDGGPLDTGGPIPDSPFAFDAQVPPDAPGPDGQEPSDAPAPDADNLPDGGFIPDAPLAPDASALPLGTPSL